MASADSLEKIIALMIFLSALACIISLLAFDIRLNRSPRTMKREAKTAKENVATAERLLEDSEKKFKKYKEILKDIEFFDIIDIYRCSGVYYILLFPKIGYIENDDVRISIENNARITIDSQTFSLNAEAIYYKKEINNEICDFKEELNEFYKEYRVKIQNRKIFSSLNYNKIHTTNKIEIDASPINDKFSLKKEPDFIATQLSIKGEYIDTNQFEAFLNMLVEKNTEFVISLDDNSDLTQLCDNEYGEYTLKMTNSDPIDVSIEVNGNEISISKCFYKREFEIILDGETERTFTDFYLKDWTVNLFPNLSKFIGFIHHINNKISKSKNVCVHCDNGGDYSTGVTIICLQMLRKLNNFSFKKIDVAKLFLNLCNQRYKMFYSAQEYAFCQLMGKILKQNDIKYKGYEVENEKNLKKILKLH